MPWALPEPYHAWAVGVITLVMVGLLMSGRFGSDIVFMGVLAGLLVLGVVDGETALSGFSNSGVITVALLYVVASGMKQTGAMNLVAGPLLAGARSPRSAMARMVGPVVALSAFVNNTPIVAMFMPVLDGVAKRVGCPASKLFMPLSFASIIGGVCTLIGTSTNLVVAGLLIQHDVRHLGEPVRFGMFTLSAVGVPIAAAGVAYMLLVGGRLLPGGRGSPGRPGEARAFMTAMRVGADSGIVGKTIEGAGLRHLPGLFLSRIDRAESSVVAVAPEEVIRAGDTLLFVGDLDAVVDLQQIRGLTPVTDERGVEGPRHRRELNEAVVSASSRFVGETIREAGIRTRYEAVVLAVHRRGHALRGRIGDIRLRAGDTLLLESGAKFAERFRDSADFILVTQRAKAAAPDHGRAWLALAIMAGLVAAVGAGLVDTLVGSIAAAGAMVVTRCCTGPQARAAVDWSVLITIAAAFGLGAAMTDSGLAGGVAEELLGLVGGLGPWAPLAGVYALTVVFTSVMTNNAAAALMFPIAMSVAGQSGQHPLVFAVAVAIAASCEFSTPIGYQTNLMVMGPGGYRWLDYTRFGGPLTVLCGVVCVVLAPRVYG